MKKIFATLVATALVAPLAAAPAQAHDRDRGRHDDHRTRVVVVHKDVKVKRWNRGERFDRRYAPNYRVINYGQYRRLGPPPRGHQWVRSGNDAVLIGVTSGIVSAVVSGLFN